MPSSMGADLGCMILRLAGLGLAYGHGWGKIVRLAGGEGERFVAGVAELGFPLPWLFAWAAALSECGGGVCIALGLATRWAAAFAGATMLVAAFVRHHALDHLWVALGFIQVDAEQLEAWGDPELALIYLAALLALVLLGPGRWSLDHWMRRLHTRGAPADRTT